MWPQINQDIIIMNSKSKRQALVNASVTLGSPEIKGNYITFKQAVRLLFDATPNATQPSASMSACNPANGVWSLRSTSGFIAFVSSTTGRVWNPRGAS